MDIDLYIKHIFRLLPIYEKAQIDNDYSNYLQSIEYSIQEMSIASDSIIVSNIIKCIEELKEYHNYNHYNVRKVVLFCVNKLKTLK